MRRMRVGLVGVMSAPFPGDKEGRFAASVRDLEGLAGELGFDLFPVREGVCTPDAAAAAARALRAQAVDFLLVQTSSFAGGGLLHELVQAGAPIGLWAVAEGAPGRGPLPLNSFCAANMYAGILGTHSQDYRFPVKWFYGPVSGDLFRPRLALTVRALGAAAALRKARVGLIGGVAPGFDNLQFDERDLAARLGVRLGRHEFDEVKSRAAAYTRDQAAPVAAALARSASHVDPGMAGALEQSARVMLALTDLAVEGGYHALAVSCWPKFQTELGLGVCATMGQINAAGLPAACEGDVYSAVSMLALRHLTGQTTALMDLVDADPADQSVLLWHCGPGPAPLADGEGLRLERHWLLSRATGQEMGLMGNLTFRSGEATIMAFCHDFTRLYALSGRFDSSKPGFSGARGWLGSLRWCGVPVGVPDLMNTVMAHAVQHHYPLVYGDWTDAVHELAGWLRLPLLPVRPYQPYLQWEAPSC